MTIKTLVFEYRPSEQKFFDENKDLANFDITFFEESLNENSVKELSQEIKDSTSVISVFVESTLTEDIIKEFKNLRIISTRSTGTDHINQKICKEKNIAVLNVADYGSKAVAQYITGLMLALVRKIVPASKYITNIIDNVSKRCTDYIGRDLSELTFGAVGTGAIGASVCKIAHSFGMKILAYDLRQLNELQERYNVEYVDYETLIRNSDIISLHVPYTGENRNMVAENEFKLMKKSAYLINTARGELVSIPDLYNALEAGEIAGAALDVTTCEYISFNCDKLGQDVGNLPLECVNDVYTLRKMAKLKNIIITPHIAYQTQEAVDYILRKTFNGIMDYIKGENGYMSL